MTPHAPQNNGWMDPDPKGMWFHADEVEALESGFAKLEAENAELRKQCAAFHAEANDHYRASLAANASLDRLRDAVPEVLPPHMSWKDALDGARAILYPRTEKDNEQ